MAIGDGDLLASTSAHLQARFGVPALYSLVVHPFAGRPQLQIDHPGAGAAMAMRQSHELCAECFVPVPGAGVGRSDAALMRITARARRSLKPCSVRPRTTVRRAGAVTTFFAAPLV